MSDEEQLEKLRDWWRENGRAVIAGVVIAVGGVVGWQQWGAYQDRQAEAASAAYTQFIESRESGADHETVVRRGERVINDHASSVYAPMAGFQLADYQASQGELQAAAETLRRVVETASDGAFRNLAHLRLAQVLYGLDQLDEALAALDDAESGPFDGRYHELRGDIHAARGNAGEARAAYEAALAVGEVPRGRRALIELKLSELGGEASA